MALFITFTTVTLLTRSAIALQADYSAADEGSVRKLNGQREKFTEVEQSGGSEHDNWATEEYQKLSYMPTADIVGSSHSNSKHLDEFYGVNAPTSIDAVSSSMETESYLPPSNENEEKNLKKQAKSNRTPLKVSIKSVEENEVLSYSDEIPTTVENCNKNNTLKRKKTSKLETYTTPAFEEDIAIEQNSSQINDFERASREYLEKNNLEDATINSNTAEITTLKEQTIQERENLEAQAGIENNTKTHNVTMVTPKTYHNFVQVKYNQSNAPQRVNTTAPLNSYHARRFFPYVKPNMKSRNGNLISGVLNNQTQAQIGSVLRNNLKQQNYNQMKPKTYEAQYNQIQPKPIATWAKPVHNFQHQMKQGLIATRPQQSINFQSQLVQPDTRFEPREPQAPKNIRLDARTETSNKVHDLLKPNQGLSLVSDARRKQSQSDYKKIWQAAEVDIDLMNTPKQEIRKAEHSIDNSKQQNGEKVSENENDNLNGPCPGYPDKKCFCPPLEEIYLILATKSLEKYNIDGKNLKIISGHKLYALGTVIYIMNFQMMLKGKILSDCHVEAIVIPKRRKIDFYNGLCKPTGTTWGKVIRTNDSDDYDYYYDGSFQRIYTEK